MAKNHQKKHLYPISIDGEHLSLEKAHAIAQGAPLLISPSVQKKVEASHAYVKKIAHQNLPVYGVNTGFGYFANVRISHKKLQSLQLNLLKSHASGYGKALTLPETRLAMALRLNVLVKGFAGVRFDLCQALLELIQAEIYPIIPEFGSVGASGDLAPLAHLALPLAGLGLVHYQGEVMPAKEALKQANLKPIKLVEKEGLGLINGTQIMLAVGSLSLIEAQQLIRRADKIAALTYEALHASVDPLNALIHQARKQQGQIISAQAILDELKGSYLFKQGQKRARVQDPYSIRCAPQIHGPSRDAIAYACQIAETELNAATDNPLVFADHRLILSGGNFHGQALALAFDFAAMSLSEIANVSERRLELMLNPHLSGLPAFLTPEEGIYSGYMATQYLSASLVNDNKILANPACTDSIPGNVGIEDHVSMGMTSARKLKQIVKNTHAVLAVEMLAAAQAIDLREAFPLGFGTKETYHSIRSSIPFLKKDRIVSEDVLKATQVLEKL